MCDTFRPIRERLAQPSPFVHEVTLRGHLESRTSRGPDNVRSLLQPSSVVFLSGRPSHADKGEGSGVLSV